MGGLCLTWGEGSSGQRPPLNKDPRLDWDSPSRTETETLWRDKHLWKHYLPANSVKTKFIWRLWVRLWFCRSGSWVHVWCSWWGPAWGCRSPVPLHVRCAWWGPEREEVSPRSRPDRPARVQQEHHVMALRTSWCQEENFKDLYPLLAVADNGFSWRGRQLPKWVCLPIIIANFFLKTAWKWKNLDPEGGASMETPPLPLDLPMVGVSHLIPAH